MSFFWITVLAYLALTIWFYWDILVSGRVSLHRLHYRIYLQSWAWERTKVRRKKKHCENCEAREGHEVQWLELHHVDYKGTPTAYWWRLLLWPIRYVLFIRIDTKSKMKTLCDNCHEFVRTKGLIK